MTYRQEIDALLHNLILSIEKINAGTQKVTSLNGDIGFDMFSMPRNIIISRLDPSEYGFKQVINLMYILFIDKNAFKLKDLVKDRIVAYKIPYSNEFIEKLILPKNKSYIHSFRTFFFHSIPRQNGDLSSIEDICVQWYELNLNRAYPLTEEDWDKCLHILLSQLLNYLSMIENVLNIMLEADIEIVGDVITKWITVERMQYEFNEVKSVADSGS